MLDKLKIIPADRILPFEMHSKERSAKLAQELLSEGKLKNPLLVYSLDDDYLMLDDASVLHALQTLDISHVPVQLADAADLTVHAWQRVVTNWTRDELLWFCGKFPRQVRVIDTGGRSLARSESEIRFNDGAAVRLAFKADSHLVRAAITARLCACLNRSHKTFRANLGLNDPDPLRQFPDASAVVYPPAFTITELADIARRNILLPRGIVRIDQPGRILGIDFSLSILKEEVSSVEKELFLRQLLHMRMSSDRTTYYFGSVFMFNN